MFTLLSSTSHVCFFPSLFVFLYNFIGNIANESQINPTALDTAGIVSTFPLSISSPDINAYNNTSSTIS